MRIPGVVYSFEIFFPTKAEIEHGAVSGAVLQLIGRKFSVYPAQEHR
jgi:hypothetical protein